MAQLSMTLQRDVSAVAKWLQFGLSTEHAAFAGDWKINPSNRPTLILAIFASISFFCLESCGDSERSSSPRSNEQKIVAAGSAAEKSKGSENASGDSANLNQKTNDTVRGASSTSSNNVDGNTNLKTQSQKIETALKANEAQLPQVFVSKQPIKISQKQIPSTLKLDHDGAWTRWYFHFFPELKFQIVDEKQSKTDYRVSIKVTNANIRLTLPIIVYTHADAPKRTTDHERGHVDICRHVYRNSETIARESAIALMRKVFQGQGPDRDSAISAAMRAASEELSAAYRKRTVDKVNRTSKIYDDIDLREELPIDQEVAKAEQLANK